MDIVYQLMGTERTETARKKVDAGILVATSYFDKATGELLRRDLSLAVDADFMLGALTGKG